jgi:aminomethyltransferase
MSDLKSPLYQWHQTAGAKLADFGGWDMPIEYPLGTRAGSPGGVIAEHTSVRERVGLFDVSHLGKIQINGTGALEYLNTMLTNDLHKIENGSAQYNLICNDQGGVIDDLIVYRRSEEDLFLIPNAANCAEVVRTLQASAPNGISITNLHQGFGVLALQGPLSQHVMRALGITIDFDYMAFTEEKIPGHENLGTVIICRTGYTGEYGFELIPQWEQTLSLWEILVDEIAKLDGRVCGLGSRDTLRTEMGYPLHGHELSLDIAAIEAGAAWAVVLSKPEFKGKAALTTLKESGVKRSLKGIRALDRGIPRADMRVLKDGGSVGVITSGTFSPTLKVGIGLALLDPTVKIGERLTIDIRGRLSEVEVVKAPFVPSRVR